MFILICCFCFGVGVLSVYLSESNVFCFFSDIMFWRIMFIFMFFLSVYLSRVI